MADIQIEENILITMRDGVNISVDLYRPAAKGQYPTLYAAAPYPHNDDALPPDNALTGPVAWYVSQGYSYVIASTRGTGLSEGKYGFLSIEEQQDHYELIEWIAQQEWSNGKVAGVGASYYATAQWQMAIQNPPHLKCIAPYNGVVQPYQDWAFPGGLANSAFSQSWYHQEIRQANAFPRSEPGRIIEYDINLQLLLHPEYDDYWRLRSSQEHMNEISIPVFMIRDWNQNTPGLNGTFTTLDQLNSVHRLLILESNTDESIYKQPSFQEQELLPFYRWCLGEPGDKNLNEGEQTSFIEQPRIRYQVRGNNQTKRENTWPPGNTSSTPLFLNRQSVDESEITSLNFSALNNNISASHFGSGLGSGSDTGTEYSFIKFISESLEQDMEITGPITLELYANSSATQTAFEVKLTEQLMIEENPQPQTLPSFLLAYEPATTSNWLVDSEVLVSRGVLKTPPLKPGEVTRLDISLQPTSYHFKQGNRLLVEISKISDGSLTNKPRQDSIFHNTRYPTRLWLPLVQSIRGNSPQSVVDFDSRVDSRVDSGVEDQ